MRARSPPALPWLPPPHLDTSSDDDDDDDDRRLEVALDGDVREPQHCSRKEQICKGPDHVTVKQRRKMREISMLLGEGLPEAAAEMSRAEADLWLRDKWIEWRRAGAPIN